MEFERNEVEHTFSTGRTFIIRRSIPMTVLLFKAIEDGDPELAEGLSEWVEGGGEIQAQDESPEARMSSMRMAGKITRTVIEAMFLSPRVVWESDGPLPGDTILVEDLRDEEMNEVIETRHEVGPRGGPISRRRRLASTVAQVARTWSKSPSDLLGLRPGSVEAFVVDRDLAELLAGEARREPRRASTSRRSPPTTRAALPDPFARAPGELGGLS